MRGMLYAKLNFLSKYAKSITNLMGRMYFEWYVVGCGSKNGYQKDVCLKEIGLRAQNMITILGSIVDVIGGTRMTT